ncbi:MAG: M1 family metallopeptidase [Bacteroidia bacterium]|nr:M1 family metallopeptidase [Bacteroidia bacterium]
MKFYHFLIAVLFAFAFNKVQSQSVFQAKWQQTVNYKIDVSLDEYNHLLRGFETIEYQNNSPNVINEIYIHLWPNAYKNNSTSFALNLQEEGNFNFKNSTDIQKGYIDSLDFFIDGKSTVWSFDTKNVDVAKITLNKSLQSGQKCIISTPFLVKIPDIFSRFGHYGNSYNITQWYPKPAVYDTNGWNIMPYLNQGEFYSEYGNFEVNITLPKNYVVAATGKLQDNYEVLFRNMKGKTTGVIENTFCKTPLKTLKFKQENIHDFAWFASKQYGIRYSNLEIGGKTIDTYIFSEDYKDLSYENMESIKKAVMYYSDKVGYYPYEHVTVVRSKLKAGGGMEYPMITVCDILNEEIIIHEVGHNWFYGIIGSNERRYPWMDESVNSYFTEKTITDYRKKRFIELKNPIMADLNSIALYQMAINALRENKSQSITLNSADYSETDYGTVIYGKGAYVLKHLADFLGEDVYFKCYRKYFDLWKYKHPLPGDMQKIFEAESGKNLNWFFNDILNNKQEMDFKIKSIKKQNNMFAIKLKKKNYSSVPVSITFYENNKKLCKIWSSQTDTLVKYDSTYGFTHVIIDESKNIFESNIKNNVYINRIAFRHIYKPQINLGSGLDITNKTIIYALPLIAYNIHNGFMLGGAIHNFTFPYQKFEYWFSPFYSFRSKTLDGYANLNYRLIPKKHFQSIIIGMKNSSFVYLPAANSEKFKYYRSKIYTQINFKSKNPKSKINNALLIEYNNVKAIWLEKISEEPDSNRKKQWFINNTEDIKYHNLKFTFNHSNSKVINPYSFKIFVEAGKYKSSDSAYLKPGLEVNYFKTYKKKNKGFAVRFFTGTFFSKQGFDNGLFMYRLGSKNGLYDYNFDNALAGRGANSGLWSRNIIAGEDNMKLVGTLGNFSKAFATLNLSTTIPGKIPLRFYSDFCFMRDSLLYNTKGNPQMFIFSSGIAIDVIPDILIIHIPFIQSEALSNNKFGDNICFTLKLNELEPHNLIKKIKLF